MKEIKLVITEPFLNGPSWLTNNPGLEIIVISGASSKAEVDGPLKKRLGELAPEIADKFCEAWHKNF